MPMRALSQRPEQRNRHEPTLPQDDSRANASNVPEIADGLSFPTLFPRVRQAIRSMTWIL
jgi:hypothetical protein